MGGREREVCVLGLGLIGGSLLRAAVTAGRTAWGASASEATAASARADGFDAVSSLPETLERAAARDALVVVATPLPALADVLPAIAAHAPTCRLTDVVGVKAPVAAAVARHAPATRYVGGHPMAGTAESGWAAGDPGLFHGAAWVVAADDGVDLDVWADVARLALACGAAVVPASATEHDAAVARVSHLPHLLAAVLASVGSEGGPLALALAAGSFADGTRVAGTRPELVLAMCEGNRAALLAAVDDALGLLGATRGSLASTGGLKATIHGGHQARRTFEARQAREVSVDLTEPDVLERLRELGRSGARVVGVRGPERGGRG